MRLCSVALLLAVFAHAFDRPKVGQLAPNIELDRVLAEGSPASVDAIAGKAVVLEFWATWCGPCVAAIPHLNELTAQFKDRPVVFLSVTDEEPAVVEKFLKERPIRGWIGFDKGTKLNDRFGVEGIPDTFLIDASGKVAANLYPDQLKPEMIEDLVAGRPVKAPSKPSIDLAVKRTDDAGAPPPLADFLLRPSADNHVSGMSSGKGKLSMKGGEMRWFFSFLYQTPADRVIGGGLDREKRYDLAVSLPGATSDALYTMAREFLCAGFQVTVQRETRDADVFVLTAPNGKPAALTENGGGGGSGWNTGNGKLQMTNGGFRELAGALESILQKPVLDECRIAGRYDITLRFEGPEGLLDEVRKLGLKIEPVHRPVEFLVVSPAR
jgi:uncharacterized protein (TIGR03435 family)